MLCYSSIYIQNKLSKRLAYIGLDVHDDNGRIERIRYSVLLQVVSLIAGSKAEVMHIR